MIPHMGELLYSCSHSTKVAF